MTIDWAASGAWMQAWAGFAQAGAVVIAAVLATNTFASWRKQKVEERRIDAAERVLTLAYRVKQAFAVIRSPRISSQDREEATINLLENGLDLKSIDLDRQNKIVESQVILDRINRYVEIWNEFPSTMPVASALLGDDIDIILGKMWRQKTAIEVAASEYPLDDGKDDRFTKDLRSTLWENRTPGENDRIISQIDANLYVLETKLLPIIRAS